ncbi:MAG: hypothetical protein WC626_07455 [Methanoregula sp.]
MQYSDTIQPKKNKGKTKISRNSDDTLIDSVPCVMESVPGTPGNQKIERILSDILVKLERIEEKIDEAVYPPESAIKPAYIKKIKEIDAGLTQKKANTYASMDEFIRNIKQ